VNVVVHAFSEPDAEEEQLLLVGEHFFFFAKNQVRLGKVYFEKSMRSREKSLF